MGKHIVAALAEIPPGSQKLVHVRGRAIAVFNVNGELFGISDTCPHQGGSLATGATVGLTTSEEPGKFCHSRPGEFVRCPWHSWEFDLRTGQSWCDPRKFRTRPYDLSVEPGEALVAGPYVAETFGISVEDQYIVVEL
ncbi:3-phenylpropionate/trans-cinnamate dioxygenase ferredoxin subunit [Xaviernesmea oryzae]|uniref:3-phenylpropionate/trans-cinnamate dioxygenase ferredoxin subunit n=1 Tax=Xaviernesmea oryzae TaxID=464029 RepID=A0A1X7EKR5_9HYPH|nr:Rieske (2Fe-2S) protein [Xaviernesmea oryzae]SMF35458.1 3-phenylpropionate/trans-cinnamate dioxygenase ferredoxin subunit [Xaviernesmea oryzae]